MCCGKTKQSCNVGETKITCARPCHDENGRLALQVGLITPLNKLDDVGMIALLQNINLSLQCFKTRDFRLQDKGRIR
jgi:hypothetical protein